VKRAGPCLAYSQTLQHLLHGWCLLVRDSLYLLPLGQVVSRQSRGNGSRCLGRVLLYRWRSSPTVPRCYTGGSDPGSWFGDLGSLCSCHTLGTISRHRSLSATSSSTDSSVLLTPRGPSEGLPWNSASNSFT
jgi:hypothetical protein